MGRMTDLYLVVKCGLGGDLKDYIEFVCLRPFHVCADLCVHNHNKVMNHNERHSTQY
jgi:hypothetical protein